MEIRQRHQRQTKVDPEHELRQVMTEIIEALRGTAATLTLHPNGRPPELIFANLDGEHTETIAFLLGPASEGWADLADDTHVWLNADFGSYAPHAMVLPIRRVPGHSRLFITVFFSTIEAERKASAEATYLQRRPFAVGYFRLWQEERLARREVEALHSTLDRVGLGVMLVTKSGMLSFVNSAARMFFGAGDGIVERHGRLRAYSRSDNILLEASVGQILESSDKPRGGEAVPLFIIQRKDRSPLVLAALSVPNPVTEDGEVAALVFAVDPDLEVGDLASAICSVFHLTRAETQLACELASGRTLLQSASKLRIKEDTARSYLRSIFSKTGTNRQTDLVRLILMSLMRVSD